MASIGFIGLGNMGAPMAANLVKAGHGVTGYDLNPAALRTLTAAGGRGAVSASEAANRRRLHRCKRRRRLQSAPFGAPRERREALSRDEIQSTR